MVIISISLRAKRVPIHGINFVQKAELGDLAISILVECNFKKINIPNNLA